MQSKILAFLKFLIITLALLLLITASIFAVWQFWLSWKFTTPRSFVESTADWKTFTVNSKTYVYTFKYPPGWRIENQFLHNEKNEEILVFTKDNSYIWHPIRRFTDDPARHNISNFDRDVYLGVNKVHISVQAVDNDISSRDYRLNDGDFHFNQRNFDKEYEKIVNSIVASCEFYPIPTAD